MPGTVKKLQFSEGTDVGAPTDLSLQTSTSVIKTYANDAAYIVDQPAAEGGVYLNTTTNKFRMYVSGAWRNAVPESDASDATKTFLVDLTSQTTGISSTLKFIASGNRIYTFPNGTDDVVLRTFTQILTNKELTSALLELPIVKGTVKSIDVDTAANLAIGGSVGANNITIGGVSSTIIIPGNFTINGTITAINSTNLDVTDKNITINKGGNDASSIGAGITVDRTSTKGSFLYDSTLGSLWKAGALGSEVEIANVSSNQTLTNKRMHLHTTVAANDATSPRVVLPQNTLANLQAITSGNHPAAGAVYWGTDVLQSYVWNGSSLTPLGGSGSGSGEINAILNPNAANDLTGYTNGTSHVATRVTSGSPLDPIITTAISIAASANATESNTSGTYYTLTIAPGLKSRKLKLEFWFTSPAAHSWNVSVYAGGTRVALSTDASGASVLPANLTGKYTTYFDTDATNTTYKVNLTKTAGTGSATLVATSLIFGPGIQPQGALITEWQAYTPTFNGLGTVTSSTAFWRRYGDTLEIKGTFTTGTVTAVPARVSIPSGLTINTSALTRPALVPGSIAISIATTNGVSNRADLFVATGQTTNLSVCNTGAGGSTNIMSETTGSAGFSNATQSGFAATGIPIAEWAGSGTVNLAQNDVEYAYNTSTSDANDTTSFAYGPGGGLVPGTLTASRTKRVRFQTPIQVTDVFEIEFNNGGNLWVPMALNDYQNIVTTFRYQGTLTYGIGLSNAVVGQTDLEVAFGQYYGPTSASYAAAGGNWASVGGQRYRVKKTKAGSASGFGLVQGTTSGLYPGLMSQLDDVSATRMGLKQYLHGTTYNGGNAPTVTASSSGSWTNLRSMFVPYQMQDGTWRMRFNIMGSFSGTSSGANADVAVNGISLNNEQAISVWLNLAQSSGGKVFGTNNFRAFLTSASTYNIGAYYSGDIELAGKPTWAY